MDYLYKGAPWICCDVGLVRVIDVVKIKVKIVSHK